MTEYRLKPLIPMPIRDDEWRIGAEGAIVSGTVRLSHRGPLGNVSEKYDLTIWTEVGTGDRSAGAESVYVNSLEEAVALVEAKRLEAFKYDIEPAGANPAPNSP